MSMDAILERFPGAADVLAAYGLHCVHCGLSGLDTLEEGALLHGMELPDLEALARDIGALAQHAREPATLHLTKAGAQALRSVAKTEKKTGKFLRVVHEAAGGFSLEFVTTVKKEDRKVSHPDVPELTVIVSPTTLRHIGGATIDFREGRFALDLGKSKGCGEESGCAGRDL